MNLGRDRARDKEEGREVLVDVWHGVDDGSTTTAVATRNDAGEKEQGMEEEQRLRQQVVANGDWFQNSQRP